MSKKHILIFLITIPCLTFAESHENVFAKKDVLQCADKKIVITTSCLEREANLSYCFNQNISFIKNGKNGELISNSNFNYSFNNGNQEFISGATCVSDDNKFYVVLSNTNFSNCKICEWADIFSSDGNYMGSTKGMYSNQSFKRKLISRQLENKILNPEKFTNSYRDLNSVQISRTN
jgi:hypothetical protein